MLNVMDYGFLLYSYYNKKKYIYTQIHNRARERKSTYGNDHRDVMVRRKWGFMMERILLEFVLVRLYLRPAWGRGEGGKNA